MIVLFKGLPEKTKFQDNEITQSYRQSRGDKIQQRSKRLKKYSLLKSQKKYLMKHISIITVLLIAMTFAFKSEAQSRSISDFSKISISGNVGVKLIKSDTQKLDYKMIKGSESDLITEVKGENLVVKIKSDYRKSNKSQAKVIVYYKTLSSIGVASGASLKNEETIRAENINIEVSSGANANLQIIAKNIDLEASSGATLKIKGEAEEGSFEASSGSNINAKLLICDTVNADAASGASIKVHANKALDADVGSGGRITYTGDVEDSTIGRGRSGQISRI
jgi:hypothetical protein